MINTDAIASAIDNNLTSHNVADSNLEPANIVDVLHAIAIAGNRIAHAIMPTDAAPGQDENGGAVASVTEGLMSVSASGCRIAGALQEVADAIRAVADRPSE